MCRRLGALTDGHVQRSKSTRSDSCPRFMEKNPGERVVRCNTPECGRHVMETGKLDRAGKSIKCLETARVGLSFPRCSKR